MIVIKPLRYNPKKMVPIFISAVLLPSGEIVRQGETVEYQFEELSAVFVDEDTLNNL